jgi:hypothetical protein
MARKNIILEKGKKPENGSIDSFIKAIKNDMSAVLRTEGSSYVFIGSYGTLSSGILTKHKDGQDYVYDLNSKTWKRW